MIDLTIDRGTLKKVAAHTRERNVRIPTLAQMRDPSLIPTDVREGLADVGLWDLHPLNLFRISWHNEPIPQGGGFGGVNFVGWPSELTGVDVSTCDGMFCGTCWTISVTTGRATSWTD